MNHRAKLKLQSYVSQKVGGIFPKHSVTITVKVNAIRQEITINVRSQTLSLAGVRRSPRFRKFIKRLPVVLANYFNEQITSVRVMNSIKTPYPFYYSPAEELFISWLNNKQPSKWVVV